MVKSELQKIIDIFQDNKTIQRLFNEFKVDFESVAEELVNDCLLEYDEVIQENTVYNLAENPMQRGRAHETQITLAQDISGSLNETWFWVYTTQKEYYVWFNVNGLGSDPTPVSLVGGNPIGIEIAIAENASPAPIASVASNQLNNTGDFITDINNNYQNIPATTEITTLTFTDDTTNANANYAGRYILIFNGSDQFYVWYDIENTNTAPAVSGTGIEVDLNASDTEDDIAQKTADAINQQTEFTASSTANTTTIETALPGDSDDADVATAASVIDIDIISQGNDAFTQTSSKLKVLHREDGQVIPARDSQVDPTGFGFSVLTQGRGDQIAALNAQVSQTLGLFPQFFQAPHEDNYRAHYSEDRTQYTFFLKWIYYLYKYFNEEQFFFHNLLDHFVPEYDTNIISSTTNLKIYFDGLGILLDTLDQKIEEIYTLGNIDETEERFLQHIAQLLGYQKEDFSIKNISFRELIKNLVEIYQRKGTSYSFELFFKLLGFNADLREYFWDRDARNPEGFASITNFNYLYYLTTQDPRTRTQNQLENMALSRAEQPISLKNWSTPKDLREFERLQRDYSIDEILGFTDSDIPVDKRFTYFKTNFINFKLSQFYTKQDLTAKDTDTILKYVKFLTPIYVSAFVEVVTTPWEDTFEQNNPLADDIIIEGGPGDPRWVDILLPFLSITLKEYIPLSLDPADEKAVIVAMYGSTNEDLDGQADDVLPLVFGDPSHGINIIGDVAVDTNLLDLSENKYINLKVDKGRGQEIELNGNTIQTYQQIINRINQAFSSSNIDATAFSFGAPGSVDIRIESNTLGTNSKIYLANGLINDLFLNISAPLETPINGSISIPGYHDFGLSLNNIGDLTGLDPSKKYYFYVNVDDDDFIEIDVSGETPSSTSIQDIRNQINNHYTTLNQLSFITSTITEYIDATVISNGRIVIAYRDVSTNSGALQILNADGSVFRAGINFSRFDARDVTMAPSKDESLGRFFLSYYDMSTGDLKWTVYNNDGDKIINDKIIEFSSSQVQEIKAITLSDNNVALVYTTNSPAAGAVRVFDLSGPQELIGLKQWYNSGITSIDAISVEGGFVVAGNAANNGEIVFLDNTADFSINSNQNDSTKTFAPGQQINGIKLANTSDDGIFIAYHLSVPSPSNYTGWATVWDDQNAGTPTQRISPIQIINEDIEETNLAVTDNLNILITYKKRGTGYSYYKIYNKSIELQKKEQIYFDSEEVKEISTVITPTGDLAFILLLSNRGVYIRQEYLGNIASITFDGRLEITSVAAGDTWDDTVENYAQASDEGHKFEMDGTEYEYDNYSTYLSSIGVDFTSERNRYNTFYETSPNDDLVPLVEDTLSFLFTLLISSNLIPSENVDKMGFYPSRNGYISRAETSGVKGNNYKGYWLRHLDISEDVRTDPEGVKTDLNWPQWEKYSDNEINEVTVITLQDDTANQNANYSNSYFTIYNGLTKFIVWYKMSSSVQPAISESLFIKVSINPSDTSQVIAQKTRASILAHPAADYSVNANANELTIESLVGWNSKDAESSNSSLINVGTAIQGENSASYQNWSSWAMAIDYFRPKVDYPTAIIPNGGIKMAGISSPAGPYKEFVYGIPKGITAGAWLISGDPTGEAIIEFTINNPNPATTWPNTAKVSFVEESTGQWKTMENTVISSNGKTISAVTDHFSIWGVTDDISGDLLSDDYSIDVQVSNAKIIEIKEINDGPSGLGFLGGTGTPYGPYEEFEAPAPTGFAEFSGLADISIGADLTVPKPTGRISIAGFAEIETALDFLYAGTGSAQIKGKSPVAVGYIYEIVVSVIVVAGAATTNLDEYVASPSGAVVSSGAADYTYSVEHEALIIVEFIDLRGIAVTSRTSEIAVDASGKIEILGEVGAASVSKKYSYIAIESAVLISGSGGSTIEFIRDSSGSMSLSGDDIFAEIANNYDTISTAITTAGEAAYQYSIFEIGTGGYTVTGSAPVDSIDIEFIVGIETILLTGEAEREFEILASTSTAAISINGQVDYIIEVIATTSEEKKILLKGSAPFVIETSSTLVYGYGAGGLATLKTNGSATIDVSINALIESLNAITLQSAFVNPTSESLVIEIIGSVEENAILITGSSNTSFAADDIAIYSYYSLSKAIETSPSDPTDITTEGLGLVFEVFGGITTTGSNTFDEIDITFDDLGGSMFGFRENGAEIHFVGTSVGELTITPTDSDYYPEITREGSGSITLSGTEDINTINIIIETSGNATTSGEAVTSAE